MADEVGLEWVEVRMMPTMVQIVTMVTNRLFVGNPLCMLFVPALLLA